MTPGRRSGRILAVMLALGGGLFTHGAEPWADPRLAITNGIALYYDASRQTAARGAVSLSPLRSWNDAVDLLLDGSGYQRDAVQPLAAARPGFAVNWGIASLEFDGKDDFLSGVRGLPAGTNATVFLVVSIREFGGFRGLLAWSAGGRNDYTSGFNLDVGSLSATNLARLNVEGAGFAGERNLLDRPRPAGDWQILGVTVGSDPPAVRLRVDGEVAGGRPRAAAGPMLGEELTLGARVSRLSALAGAMGQALCPGRRGGGGAGGSLAEPGAMGAGGPDRILS